MIGTARARRKYMDPCSLVHDWMSRSLFTVDPQSGLDCADRAMRLAHARHVPVVSDGVPVGILSIRDLFVAKLSTRSLGASAPGGHPGRVRVDQVMRPVFAIDPEESIVAAAESMRHNERSCLVVLRDQKLVGLLTTADILRFTISALEEESRALGEPTRAGRFMTPSPVTAVSPDEHLDLAKILMRFGHFHHLPVVADDHVIGIVSDRDLLEALNGTDGVGSDTQAEQMLKIAHLTVRQIMTPHPITVTPETEAPIAAALLLDKQIGALPVVRAGKLVGMLTERDFLSFVIASAPIKAEIRV